MTWVILGLVAGLVLGASDFLTKIALREKDVLQVVFFTCMIGSLCWIPFLFAPTSYASFLKPLGLFPAMLSLREQVALFPKALVMVINWMLSYYAMKALPVSISAGVRASGPLWTALGAILFLSETLLWWQWLGLAIATSAYYFFSLIGRKEGISFKRNRWVLYMLIATVLSSAIALYDKYIVVSLQLDIASVQAYSAVQRAVVALFFLPWILKDVEFRSLLRKNWAVPAIGFAYVLAEYVYLEAVKIEGAMISIISILRRTNLIMAFGLSAIFFNERYIKQKWLAIFGVLAGIALTILH